MSIRSYSTIGFQIKNWILFILLKKILNTYLLKYFYYILWFLFKITFFPKFTVDRMDFKRNDPLFASQELAALYLIWIYGDIFITFHKHLCMYICFKSIHFIGYLHTYMTIIRMCYVMDVILVNEYKLNIFGFNRRIHIWMPDKSRIGFVAFVSYLKTWLRPHTGVEHLLSSWLYLSLLHRRKHE